MKLVVFVVYVVLLLLSIVLHETIFAGIAVLSALFAYALYDRLQGGDEHADTDGSS